MAKTSFLVLVALLFTLSAFSQKQEYKIIAIGSYNCENTSQEEENSSSTSQSSIGFYAANNDPVLFTPTGAYRYTGEVYKQKMHNIATVIQKMGTDVTPDGPAVVGLVEIENDNVLKDLVAQPELAARHYQYAWFYTSDERGISTAMLYNPKYFKVLNAQPVRVPVETIGQKRPTRDVLFVSGVLSGDTVHFLVNHWPSKSGGEAASAPGRRLAATVDKHIVDSLTGVNPNAKIILMGDLNDNPTSEGVTEVLDAKAKASEVSLTGIYNPWISMYKKGVGTESYQGEWNLIDQIMVTGGLLKNNNDKWKYYNSEIFNKDFLINKMGKDKGLPHRSFTIAQVWDNGYSDHFPVLMYLVEKK